MSEEDKQREQSKPADLGDVTTAQASTTSTSPNHRHKKLFIVISILALLTILGVAAALLVTKDNTAKQTQNISEQLDEEIDTEKTQMEVAEEIYSEVAQEFGLERSGLRFFWVYGDDRVAFANKDQGPGWIFAYKTGDRWKIASDAIQYFITCDELNEVPEQYKPACATGVEADTGYLYTDALEYTDSISILLASTNYPETDKYALVDKEAGQNADTYPEDQWLLYENSDLGFSFYYPRDWSEINVRFDGKEDLFLANFSPTFISGSSWVKNGTHERAGIELRGHSDAKTEDSHGSYAKGFVKMDDEYYEFTGTSTRLIEPGRVVAYRNFNQIETLLVKTTVLTSGERLELMVNLKDKNILGLELSIYRGPLDIPSEGTYPVYTDYDVDIMKQIQASFRSL